jgi:dihydrofolate reductase
MRRIVAGLFISLDGVVDAPEAWNPPYYDEEMGQAVGSQMAESDAMLLGRRSYHRFAQTFRGKSGDEHPFAEWINKAPKYVLSTTLKEVEWENSTLIDGDVAAKLRDLKQRPGKAITVSGSAGVVRTLLRDGLLDELRLMIHPVVVGGEGHLFDRGAENSLELVDSTTFSSGVVCVNYRPAVAA